MKSLLVWFTLSITIALVTVVVAGAPPKFAPQVTYVPHEQVNAAVKQGMVAGQPPIGLIPRDMDLGVRVNVGRKAVGARAEVHSIYGHVFFIQEGSGTVVLGGELVDPKEGVPGEWTGTRTTGGKEYPVTKGDLITVQVGMPHWWKEVAKEGIVFIAFHAYPEHNQPGAVQSGRK